MVKAEIMARLAAVGAKKKYKILSVDEGNQIILVTRKPATITDGVMTGCEIAFMPDGIFNVWTSQKNKAMAWARRLKIPLNGFDGEAEMLVPGNLADEVLPAFGAKVKRVLSVLALEKLKLAWESRNRVGKASLQSNPC